MNKRQIHNSSLDTLSRCGEQFRRRYIEGEKLAPAIAPMVGTAVHSSVNKNLAKKMLTGTLMEPQEVWDIARDELVREWDKDGVLDTDEEIVLYGPAKAKAMAIDKSVRLAGLHRRVFAPTYNPTHLERKWVLDIEGFPFELAGAIDIQEGVISDRLTGTADDGIVETRVRDVKTSGKTPNQSIADESTQLTMLSYT